MIPRAIQPIEIEYRKKFPNSEATLFFDYDNSEAWLALLKDAIMKNEPLKKADLIAYYGKERFENYLKFNADLYEIPEDEILKGL